MTCPPESALCACPRRYRCFVVSSHRHRVRMVRGHNAVASIFLLGLAALVAMASSSKELDALRTGSAKFSSDLFSVLRQDKENENLVVSPISLQIALAMLYAGARGTTKEAMTKVLHVQTDDVQKYVESYKELLETIKDPVLSVASTVFVDKTLKLLDAYTTAVTKGFGASVEQVNFTDTATAAQTINNWCDKHTNGRIKNIFDADSLRDAVAVLANAVYFKASWKTKFDATRTKERDFRSPTGIVKVQMMNVKSQFLYTFSDKLNAQILELPYANDKFRMLVILPSEGTALKDVENNLKTVGLEAVMTGMYRTEVDVFLPRFKIEMTLDLNSALAKLGAGEIFQRPNLSGIAEAPLVVSQVKQKVFIEVTEEGTEAAAVTVGFFDRIGYEEEPDQAQMVVNRPFSFLVAGSEDTTLLFYGDVIHPKQPRGKHIL